MLGVLATLSVLTLYRTGAMDRFELITLDWRFRYCNPIPSSDQIVHVDIGDDALERIHRWPWPRRLHAQLIDTLKELGARAVVMDIVFTEPQPPRVPLPDADSVEDLIEKAPTLSPSDAVFDDRELRDAIARAGNVYLSMFFEMEQNNRQTTFTRRIAASLENRFGHDANTLAGELGGDRAAIERVLPGIKKTVARMQVHKVLATQPTITSEQAIEALLPDVNRDPLDVIDITAAWETERGTQAVLSRCPAIPPERQGLYPLVVGTTPPLGPLAEAARDNGFVVFEPGSVDGVLREIPLVGCYRGRLLRQLAFAVACDVLNVPPNRVEMHEGGRLVLRAASGAEGSAPKDIVIPVDERGRLLLNWYNRGGRWEASFRHLAVGRVLEIPLNRRALRNTQDRRQAARSAAVRFTTRSAGSVYDEYLTLLKQRTATGTSDPARSTTSPASRIEQIENRAIEAIRALHQETLTTQPADDEERKEFLSIRKIHRMLTDVSADAASEDQRLRQRIEDRLRELKPLIAGKVVFVGYTATAVADFVTTPVFDRAPGVMAHANLMHTILAHATLTRVPEWLNVLLVIFAALVAGMTTARRGPIFSALVVAVGLNGVIVVVALGLFYFGRIWMVLPTPLAAVLASWAVITVYRQLTEGRERRLAFNRLGQYTSPALARRLADDPQALSRAEMREVTCYFSDLRGFTSISERLGAERTQALLNVYLERMSEVLNHHEAFINKFLGDGVFAFFNPAINPQPDHIRLACEAALGTLEGLEHLIAEQAERGGDEAFGHLRCGVGLATGRVVVGNCGSERKFDYTCIGDSVNLAARLESANKAFGTRILASETTRQGTGTLYEWRCVGGLRVVGKAQPVQVFELLGRRGAVPAETLEYAARFEQGVRLYQQQQWGDSSVHFARMLARRPDDPGLMLYMDSCRQYEQFGPPEGWTGAIELKEK